MLVLLNLNVTKDEIKHIYDRIKGFGFVPHMIPGETRDAIGITGNQNPAAKTQLEVLPGVWKIMPVTKSYKLASREFHPENRIVKVGDVSFGDGNVVMIAGPCAVESYESTMSIAKIVKARGAQLMRGGAFKPRTSPYSFQGLGEEGLKILAAAREETGLKFVTEVVCAGDAELVASYADMLQIGTRNMQNFRLLEYVGKQGKPVLLKRGMSATLDETLMSAEYLMKNGCSDVVICERGIRTFSDHSRNTLDIAFIPALKKVSSLPVIVDPSHSGGKRSMVIPHSLAGIGAGADGLIVDVHDNPEEALCDGPQALLPDEFTELMRIAKGVCGAMDKKIGV
ncbi:3-deoxy-7-phosphoheptulonate synthase [bacterium]|nr:3-deoxy-7-phosphoheptulonate synthase [bacterium]